jgi:Zn finger protein HypA/HybF involved in hydrogenase expression
MNYQDMNYQEMNPGRERRLAYSRIVRYRNEIEYRNENEYRNRNEYRNSFLQHRRNALPTLEASISSFSIARTLAFGTLPPINIVRHDDSFTYENLVELKDVPVGLIQKNLIDKSTVELNFFEDNFCVICQENIDTNIYLDTSIMRVLKCTHCFHVKCIDTWFIENNKCPTCKSDLTDLDNDTDIEDLTT